MKRFLVAVHWATFFWVATFYLWMGFFRIGDSAWQVFAAGFTPHIIAIGMWRVIVGKVILFPWKLGVSPEEFVMGEVKLD